VKLGDFGLAKAGIQHPYEGATSMCGTPEYMAPEVLAQMGHGFCVDYWGLGMICYEMMTGLPPWYTTDRQQLFRRLKSAPLDIPSYFSAPSAACVTALLERNPRRRLGVTGIRTVMEHEFFRSISWRALYSRRVEAPVRPCEGWQPPEPVSEDFSTRPESLSDTLYYSDGVAKLDANTLDTATQNFDNQFLRMPVESEDLGDLSGHNGDALEEGLEDLDENTFMGFTFDIVKDREKQAAAAVAAAQEQNPSSRSRSHNYQPEYQQQYD
jgi:serine/threonine protein kinase